MFQKLLAIVCGAALLTACASQREGADLYGNSTGGWDPDVDITNLEGTSLTKQFNKEATPVVYFQLNSSDLDTTARSTLADQAECLWSPPG